MKLPSAGFTFFRQLLSCAAIVGTASLFSVQSQAEDAVPTGERTNITAVEAIITAIDYNTREISLEVGEGEIITTTASDAIARLNDFAVGDIIVATYISSIAAELREPTAEEQANPWVVIEDGEKASPEDAPGAIVGRNIRAVCVIEGMNRVTQTVMIQDSRGKYHVIGDIKPATFDMLSLGQRVVISYTEALALTLEKK